MLENAKMPEVDSTFSRCGLPPYFAFTPRLNYAVPFQDLINPYVSISIAFGGHFFI